MKKSRNLLVLFLMAVVLLSIYLWLKYRPHSNLADTKVNSERITLVNLDDEKIQKITLRSAPNGVLNFIKKNDVWTANLPFPIAQNEVKNLSYVFFGLYANGKIDESPQDLEQYGLKNPAVTIEVTPTGAKTPIIMYLGDRTPSGASYYFMLKNKPVVYTIADYNAEKFMRAGSSFRDTSLAQIDPKEISYFKLSRAGKPDLEIRSNAAESEFAQYGIGLWQMTKPYREPMTVATDKLQPILQEIASLNSVEEFVDDNPVDLNRYGLANPQGELIVKDNKAEFRLLIGKPKNEETTFCKRPESKSVFTIRTDRLSFMDAKPFDLVEKFAYIVNIDQVDKIFISGLGSNHTLTITRKPKKPTSKDNLAEFDATYRVDGKKVPESSFKNFYQSLIGLMVEAESERQPQVRTPEVKTVFYLNKGPSHEVHIDYVPYDYDFYAVFRGGKAEFLISRDQVKSMIRDLELFVKGKLKEDN